MEITQEVQYVELLANIKPHELAEVDNVLTEVGRDDDDIDYGFNADVLTIGLGGDSLVQSAVGEYTLWHSVVARHDSDMGNRRMFGTGVPVGHGLTYAEFVRNGKVVAF
jgi:hypothetical protein